MASISANGAKGHHKFTLNVNETSTSTANNTSSISWSFVLSPAVSGYSWIYQNTVPVSYSLTVNGSTYTGNIMTYDGTSTVTVRSGSMTVAHNNDGSKSISFSFSVTDHVNQYYTCGNASSSGSMTLTKINRYPSLTSGSDFNDEGNPTLKFSNPGVYNIRVKIEAGGNSQLITRDISKTATSYTFSLTEAERNTLRALAPNSKTLSVIETVCAMNGNTELNASYKTYTMSIVNANPVFTESNLSYRDSNTDTVAVTNNNQQIVQSLSNVIASITSATALKSATITSYEATLNNITRTISSAGNIDFGTINSANNLTLSVKVTDSRGNTTTATKEITFLSWALPTAIIFLKRKNNYEDETYLKATASYSSVDSKNTIAIQYQYKKTTDENYNSLTNLANDTQITLNVSKDYAWNFRIIVTDAFGSTTYNTILAKGKFIFFIDTKKLSVGVNCFPENNESLEINGVPVLEYNVIESWTDE